MDKNWIIKATRSNKIISDIWSAYRLVRSNEYVKKNQNRNTYLHETGWLKSRHHTASIDANGNPIPWITYPILHFLNQRVHSEMKVFEYGSGNSTLWWAERVNSIVSCEHDLTWYQHMKSKLPKNCDYLFYELVPDGKYSKAILDYPNYFDVVVIDGRDRVNCVENAISRLHERGVIVWDNTEREKYANGIIHLKDRGFRQLEFAGLAPMNTFTEYTSLFYRTDNVFNV